MSEFLEEVINNLEDIKNIFMKSKNEKSYIASIKNILGNVLSDKEILSLSSLNKNEFRNRLKKVYIEKRKVRSDLIGIRENNSLEKKIFLQVIDFSWRSHLQYLDQLRQVIGLRSYGQKDPLSEFKKEAFSLFEELLTKIKNEIIKFLFNLNIVVSTEKAEKEEKISNLNNKKIGRNEKCPCGSQKKYKHCCGSI